MVFVSSVTKCVVVLSSLVLLFVSSVSMLWSGGLSDAVCLSALCVPLLGCFFPYVEHGGVFLCVIWLVFLALMCVVREINCG